MEKIPPFLEEIHEVDANQILAANAEALQVVRDGQQMMQQGQSQLLAAIAQLTQVVAQQPPRAPAVLPIQPPNVVEGNQQVPIGAAPVAPAPILVVIPPAPVLIQETRTQPLVPRGEQINLLHNHM